jgi:hypothetical protein
MKNEYHGIIIDLSQKNKSVLKSLEILGRKKKRFEQYTVSLLPSNVTLIKNWASCKNISFRRTETEWPASPAA